jgi:hypothetical protein
MISTSGSSAAEAIGYGIVATTSKTASSKHKCFSCFLNESHRIFPTNSLFYYIISQAFMQVEFHYILAVSDKN